jgi:hypothetical protein
VIFIHVYTFEMFIHLKKALSSSFPALYKYNEYTVYKIISILDWMPIMHNINLYVAQILKDLLIFTSKIYIYIFENNTVSLLRSIVTPLLIHRLDSACAVALLKKKSGVPG